MATVRAQKLVIEKIDVVPLMPPTPTGTASCLLNRCESFVGSNPTGGAMKEKCSAHPEQELVIIKFCPCCHNEFYGKWRGGVSMSSIARELIPVEPLPQEELDVEVETTAEALQGDDDAGQADPE